MMYRITRSGLLRLFLTGARQGRQNALPMASVIDNSGRIGQNPADWNCRPDTIHTHRSGQRIC